MDPISQGVLGAAVAQSVAKREWIPRVALLGALSGMAADLDVLIRSAGDPLLFLEYHRQFTHSLIFIPVGALLCAALSIPLLRHGIPFKRTYLFCLLGFGSHGLLDACTSYGTQLFWPFSDYRVAWNNVSVVDPAFTIPILMLIAVATVRRSPRLARAACVWSILYLLLGVAQRERAESHAYEIAAARGHEDIRVVAKPAFGSLLLWKTIYLFDDRYYVDALRLGPHAKSFPGESAAKLERQRDLPWLDPESQQARDLERFSWFSSGMTALDPLHRDRIIDVRYSMVPNRIDALWGIRLDPNATIQQHANFYTSRSPSPKNRAELRNMLLD